MLRSPFGVAAILYDIMKVGIMIEPLIRFQAPLLQAIQDIHGVEIVTVTEAHILPTLHLLIKHHKEYAPPQIFKLSKPTPQYRFGTKKRRARFNR